MGIKRIATFIALLVIANTNMTSGQHMQNMQSMADMHHQDSTGSKQMHTMMRSAFSRNLTMTRDGSGTAWLPDETPMSMLTIKQGAWPLMMSGDLFLRYNHQDIFHDGSRGGDKWDAPDMVMLMTRHNSGRKGTFAANAMFSADALVAGGSGYPLLFQTGETWNGLPLADRQHPHDLFSELSASYAISFSNLTDAYLYVGYPGEPALGPVTFMHRPSARYLPDAPIGHHWEDATHITYGVTTVGFRLHKFKIEGSLFMGREPDENRYNFDKARFDSWSSRLSYNPSPNWALQASHGYLVSPEALNPAENINRNTASFTYAYNFNHEGYFSATGVLGENVDAEKRHAYAALLEATLKIYKTAVYTRLENVQKTAAELYVYTPYYSPGELFTLKAGTLGASRDLMKVAGVNMAVGAQVSTSIAPGKLTDLYGHSPVSAEVYLHFYPAVIVQHNHSQ